MVAVVHVAEDGAAHLHLGDARLADAVGKGAGAAAADDLERVAGAPAGLGARGQPARSPRPRPAPSRADRRSRPRGSPSRSRPRSAGPAAAAIASASATTGAPGSTPARFMPMLTSIDDAQRAAGAAAPPRPSSATFDKAVDRDDDRSAARAAGPGGATLMGPTIWLAIRMSLMPASAITSASPSLAQVMPMAPAASCLARDLGRLVALDVRPPADAVPAAGLGDPGDVGLHHVEIDQQRRRLQRGLGQTDEAADALIGASSVGRAADGGRRPSRHARPAAGSRDCRPHRSRTRRPEARHSTKWRIVPSKLAW